MKHTPLFRRFFVLMFALLFSSSLATAVSAQTIKSKIVKSVDCEKCHGAHGDIVVTLSNGTTVQLTKNGLNEQVRVAEDLRTIAWVEGKHLDRAKEGFGSGIITIATQFVVYRDGKKVRAFPTDFPWVRDWGFRNGGKQIAYRASPLRGTTAFILVDIATGKKIGSAMEHDKTLPDWTKNLKE